VVKYRVTQILRFTEILLDLLSFLRFTGFTDILLDLLSFLRFTGFTEFPMVS
jgi:hypothetical protein